MKLPHKDPLLAEVKSILQAKGTNSLASISRQSGVSRSCLRNWLNGTTKRPQHITMKFVLQAAGYDLVLTRRG